jgi:GH25 family lysozyme M1 (1,4-beta-N-acetylmuramidase)
MTINLKVLDISHHNDVTDFKAIYNFGIRGVIHKATQGTKIIDPMYTERKQAALDAGLLWGGYLFADNSDPIAQLDHFLQYANLGPHDLGALDYEPWKYGTMSLDQARAFLQEYERVRGSKAVLYSGNLIKETLTHKDDFFGAHRLWLAEYGPIPRLPIAWDKVWLWQFSGDGINSQGIKVPGISGELDLNSYDGSDDQLKAEWPDKP